MNTFLCFGSTVDAVHKHLGHSKPALSPAHAKPSSQIIPHRRFTTSKPPSLVYLAFIPALLLCTSPGLPSTLPSTLAIEHISAHSNRLPLLTTHFAICVFDHVCGNAGTLPLKEKVCWDRSRRNKRRLQSYSITKSLLHGHPARQTCLQLSNSP